MALAAPAAAAAQSIHIVHSPPAAAGAFTPVAIEATVRGEIRPERVAQAEVVVEEPDGGFTAFPLALSRNALFGEIPGAEVRPPRLRYYVRLVDADGTQYTTPSGAPEAGMFSVPVRGAEGPDAGGDWAGTSVDILSPLPGELVVDESPVVAVVFVPPLEPPWEVLVTVDGIDLTEAADLSSDAVVLVPPEKLADGAHRATVSAVGASGTAEASWVFFVNLMEAPGEGVGGPTTHGLSAYDREWSVAEGGARSGWDIVGNVEMGWAYVTADTTESDSLDVFLTYDEVSRPTVDFYAAGSRRNDSFLVMAQYNPLFNTDLDWRAEARNATLGLECGSVFPSLSRTTLDWASGLGAVLDARLGKTSLTLVGMRTSESDTLAGFGIYSRFALGGEVAYAWNDRIETAVVHASMLDRESSVPEEQRLTDPLRNSATAGIVRTKLGTLRTEVEAAVSSSSGEYEGSGTCARARVGLDRGLDDNVFLEYISCSEDYYSAGSFDAGPGEESIRLEFARRPHERLRLSGWAEAFTGGELQSQDGYGLRLYGRTEYSWDAAGGQARAYSVARYDRVPYEAYDYVYSYASLGGSWRPGRLRVMGNGSWSRSRSPEKADTWSASGDVRLEAVPKVWTVKGGARWTLGRNDGTHDYTRVQFTVGSRLMAGDYDLHTDYWFIDRDDRAEPEQSHTEHVVTVSVGRSF